MFAIQFFYLDYAEKFVFSRITPPENICIQNGRIHHYIFSDAAVLSHELSVRNVNATIYTYALETCSIDMFDQRDVLARFRTFSD